MVARAFLLLAIAVQATLLLTTLGGPIGTCGEQKDCLSWTITEVTDTDTTGCADAGCAYKVCVTLDTTLSGCGKADTVSHVCEWPEDQCPSTDRTATDEVVSVGSGTSWCQVGGPDQTLEFLFKDGSGCSAVDGTDDSVDFGGVTANCAPTTAKGEYCTGNGAGVECVWSVTTPACTTGPPPPPPPDFKCPKGKKVCYTDDCACVLGACNVVTGDGSYLTDGQADGTYPIPSACQDGKDLSNAVTLDGSDTCVKDEPGTALTYTIENGVVVTPMSMKCGKNCYVYGGFEPTCN